MYSHDNEHEADYLGLGLTFRAMSQFDKVGLPVSYCGFELFTAGSRIIERGKKTLSTGWEFDDSEPEKASSHPPPEVRRDAIRMAVANSHGQESINAGIITSGNC